MDPRIDKVWDYILSRGYQPCRYKCCIAAVRDNKAVARVLIPEDGIVDIKLWLKLEAAFIKFETTGKKQIEPFR